MSELKPCPFCGTYAGKERSKYVDPYDNAGKGCVHWVECTICGIETIRYHDDREAAIKSWQRRDPPHKWGTRPRSEPVVVEGIIVEALIKLLNEHAEMADVLYSVSMEDAAKVIQAQAAEIGVAEKKIQQQECDLLILNALATDAVEDVQSLTEERDALQARVSELEGAIPFMISEANSALDFVINNPGNKDVDVHIGQLISAGKTALYGPEENWPVDVLSAPKELTPKASEANEDSEKTGAEGLIQTGHGEWQLPEEKTND